MPVNLVESRSARALPLLAFLYFSICSIAPIRSYDYFWHLATGRWIVEHRAFPLTDPFSVASAQTPWINGEWLFQVPLNGLHSSGGHLAVRLARAGIVGAIFAGMATLGKVLADILNQGYQRDAQQREKIVQQLNDLRWKEFDGL